MAPDVAMSLFDPEGFGAGGFLDDVDVTIAAASVVTGADTPMKDTDAVGQTFIKVVYTPDGDDVEDRDEYYAVGPIDKFTPSKDGSRIVYEVGTKMNKQRKAAMFFAALINAGFPKSDFPADASVKFLEGLRGHVNAMPMPERTGGKAGGVSGDKKQENKRPPTVVVFTKLYDGSKPATGKKASGAGKTNGQAGAPTSAPAPQAANTAPAAGGNEVVEAETVNAIMGIIAERGSAQKRLLPTEIMQRVADVKVRTAAFKLIGDNAWLGRDGQPWIFDAGSGELKFPG